jgi:hypothetical protein
MHEFKPKVETVYIKEYYDASGDSYEDKLPDEDLVAQKSESPSGITRYKVRVNLHYDLFVPGDAQYANQSKTVAAAKRLPAYKLIEVDSDTFHKYISYLKTRKVATLKAAQRSVFNANR